MINDHLTAEQREHFGFASEPTTEAGRALLASPPIGNRAARREVRQ